MTTIPPPDEPPHIVPGQVLAVELHVADPTAAATWLARWGFRPLRTTVPFIALDLDGQLLFLGRRPPHRPPPASGTIGELRVLVADVVAEWEKVTAEDQVVAELHYAAYGLHEFVIETPFGIDLRIAAPSTR